MDCRQAFHEACCAQQGLSPEEDCNVDHDGLRLLYETERVWVVLNEDEFAGPWLNVVAKATRNGEPEMQTVEL